MDITAPTSLGPGRLTVAAAERPAAVLWLGHGAGGGIGAADLTALAAALPRLGVTVVRHEQPWRVAGRRVASRPEALDVAWRETAPLVRELAGGLPVLTGGLPVLTGGRSAGARVACRTAEELGAAGVVCLAFPLHPPGRPERSRLAELLAPAVPVLVVQGTRDTFGGAELVAAEAEGRANIRVVPVPGADHGMRVLKSSELGAHGVAELVVAAVAAFAVEVVPDLS